MVELFLECGAWLDTTALRLLLFLLLCTACIVTQPGVRYGTRSQTVIAVWRDGRVEQRERYVEKVRGCPVRQQQQQARQVLLLLALFEGIVAQQPTGCDRLCAATAAVLCCAVQVDGQPGDEEEVMWVWKEQQHEFELAAPAAGAGQAGEQQDQQQQRAGGDETEEEPWHIAKGHLQPQQQPADS